VFVSCVLLAEPFPDAVCSEYLPLECDALSLVLFTFGTWAVFPEYDRPLELLAPEDRLVVAPDALLECVELDDLLEPLVCDPLEEWEEDEWEELDDLLEDDDLDLSPLREASEASGTKIHRVKPANLRIEFLGCNSICTLPGRPGC